MTDTAAQINRLHIALAQIALDQCASNAVRTYAQAALKRDPIDVMNEITVLYKSFS